MAELVFPVLAVGAGEGPVERDAVGDDGHSEDAVAGAPVAVIVFKQTADGVAAGIGGVIPRAVIVDGPVEKLEMAVSGDIVHVHEIVRTHLADAGFEAANRNLGGERELVTVGFDHFAGEADGLVDSSAGEIGRRAEIGIADHIEIGESSETQGFAKAAAAGAFEVDQQVGVVAQVVVRLVAEIEGFDQGGFVLRRIIEAVGALVGRMEAGLGLEDGVGLAGNPPACRLAVGKHGEAGIVAGCRSGLRGGRLRRLLRSAGLQERGEGWISGWRNRWSDVGGRNGRR